MWCVGQKVQFVLSLRFSLRSFYFTRLSMKQHIRRRLTKVALLTDKNGRNRFCKWKITLGSPLDLVSICHFYSITRAGSDSVGVIFNTILDLSGVVIIYTEFWTCGYLLRTHSMSTMRRNLPSRHKEFEKHESSNITATSVAMSIFTLWFDGCSSSPSTPAPLRNK